MKPLIINIRGNSGSGKTHLTREFMKEAGVDFTITDDNDHVIGYINYMKAIKGGKNVRHKRWAVIGKYTNACGGCDTVKTQADIVARVEYFTQLGFNVWLEGLIMSTIYGTVGEYSEKFGDNWVFAYLDTPIEKCIQRIKARRKKAGQDKPLNETNTRTRVRTIERNREIVASKGRRVVVLPHNNALEPLLKIIRKEAR